MIFCWKVDICLYALRLWILFKPYPGWLFLALFWRGESYFSLLIKEGAYRVPLGLHRVTGRWCVYPGWVGPHCFGAGLLFDLHWNNSCGSFIHWLTVEFLPVSCLLWLHMSMEKEHVGAYAWRCNLRLPWRIHWHCGVWTLLSEEDEAAGWLLWHHLYAGIGETCYNLMWVKL